MKYLVGLMVLLSLGCSAPSSTITGNTTTPKNYTDNGSQIVFTSPSGNVYISQINYGSTGNTDNVIVHIGAGLAGHTIALRLDGLVMAPITITTTATDYIIHMGYGIDAFPNYYITTNDPSPYGDMLDKTNVLSRVGLDYDSVQLNNYFMKDF